MGTALDPAHIQVIINEVGKHMIQGTASVRYLKADAYLACIFLKNLLVADNDKAGELFSAWFTPF